MKNKSALLLAVLLIGASLSHAADEKPRVKESLGGLQVRATAPFPDEVTNETQAHALARDAAIALGQNELLKYIRLKKAKSERTVADAEIVSPDFQKDLDTYIKGARVVKTQWGKRICTVTLELSKKGLKELLNRG